MNRWAAQHLVHPRSLHRTASIGSSADKESLECLYGAMLFDFTMTYSVGVFLSPGFRALWRQCKK
jgi:hypothetical protein